MAKYVYVVEDYETGDFLGVMSTMDDAIEAIQEEWAEDMEEIEVYVTKQKDYARITNSRNNQTFIVKEFEVNILN